MSPIFFDSWGKAWMVCEADHDAAHAFGPTGVARRLRLHWTDFDRRDIVEGEDDWHYLRLGTARLLMLGGL